MSASVLTAYATEDGQGFVEVVLGGRVVRRYPLKRRQVEWLRAAPAALTTPDRKERS